MDDANNYPINETMSDRLSDWTLASFVRHFYTCRSDKTTFWELAAWKNLRTFHWITTQNYLDQMVHLLTLLANLLDCEKSKRSYWF